MQAEIFPIASILPFVDGFNVDRAALVRGFRDEDEGAVVGAVEPLGREDGFLVSGWEPNIPITNFQCPFFDQWVGLVSRRKCADSVKFPGIPTSDAPH